MFDITYDISGTSENEYFRINQSTSTVYQIMRICPQKKQPWDNLNASSRNCLAVIVRKTRDNSQNLKEEDSDGI